MKQIILLCECDNFNMPDTIIRVWKINLVTLDYMSNVNMAHLFQVDRVKLLCSCGVLKPITAIYLCRHCLKLRCGNCVSHEVSLMSSNEVVSFYMGNGCVRIGA